MKNFSCWLLFSILRFAYLKVGTIELSTEGLKCKSYESRRIVCWPQRRLLGKVFHIGDPNKIAALAICEIIKVWLFLSYLSFTGKTLVSGSIMLVIGASDTNLHIVYGGRGTSAWRMLPEHSSLISAFARYNSNSKPNLLSHCTIPFLGIHKWDFRCIALNS